jgi:predicted phage terminase large subunit-like protein
MRFRPKYLAGWVHRDICRRIERFVVQVERGLSPRLLISMPVRTGKSEISSRHFPAWLLGRHPDWEIIASSHTASLSLSFSRYVRDVLRDPAYLALFPGTRLDPRSQSLENWNILGGGGYLAAGRGSGISGRGAHVLLIDDLCKDLEEADSATVRDATWGWYLSTAVTRLAPGGGVLGVMTQWHEDDWVGRIRTLTEQEGGDTFEIVRYPALAEQGDEYLLPDDRIVQFPPGTTAPGGSRLLRRKGEAVHPERYTTEAMERVRANLVLGGQKRVWDCLYQQDPMPDEGVFFTKEMLHTYGSPPARADLLVFQAWDFAISEGKESDHNVCATAGLDARGNLYVLDILRFRTGDGRMLVETLVDHARHWQPDTLGMEDGMIWKALSAWFGKVCDERGYWPNFERLAPLSDKFARASPLRGRMQAGKVYFDDKAPWWGELERELLRFSPGCKHDDQVDALAWCLRLTLPRMVSQAPAPRARAGWKDRLGLENLTGVTGAGHMSA